MSVLVTGAGGQAARSLLASPGCPQKVTELARGALNIGDEQRVLEAVRELRPRLIVKRRMLEGAAGDHHE